MKAYEENGVIAPLILNLGTTWAGNWPVRRPCLFTPLPGENHGTHWTVVWVDPTADMGGLGEQKNLLPFPICEN